MCHRWPPGTLGLLISLEWTLRPSSTQWPWNKCSGVWISPQQPPGLHPLHPLVTTMKMSFIKRKECHSLSLEKHVKAFPLPFSAAFQHGPLFSTTLASFTATPPVALPSLPCAACQTGLLVSPLFFCVYGESPASTTLPAMDLQVLHSHESTQESLIRPLAG